MNRILIAKPQRLILPLKVFLNARSSYKLCKLAMITHMWGLWGLRDCFFFLKVHPHVALSAAPQQNWMAPCQSSGLVPDQPQSSTLLSKSLTLESAKPAGPRMASTSLMKAPYKKDETATQQELREVQNGLSHPPFSKVSAQERAQPDSAVQWSTREGYV